MTLREILKTIDPSDKIIVEIRKIYSFANADANVDTLVGICEYAHGILASMDHDNYLLESDYETWEYKKPKGETPLLVVWEGAEKVQ